MLLGALPKVALSRTTGVLARLPLPRPLRTPLYRAYASRYGAALDEIDGALSDFASFAAFFQRPLRAGARPLAAAPLVWPADGRIVSTGAVRNGRIEQIKGVDFGLDELLRDVELAQSMQSGSQATVYLSPGDYHRVHAPFDAEVVGVQRIPGGLYPVNPAAVAAIPRLFARNERIVLACQLTDGRPAAVVLVAALNVSDTTLGVAAGDKIARGREIARFGLGSTVVAIVGPGQPEFAPQPPGVAVRMGAAAAVP